MIDIDRERFIDLMKTQSEIGATDDGGLHRLAPTDEDKEIRDWFYDQMKQAGLDVRVDEIGNMFGRREGHDPDSKPILVGSHLDSHPHGGIYDGPLGVIAALECILTLNDQEITTSRPIEIVNWSNEEGGRFPPATMGSGVWAGQLALDNMYAQTDEHGSTFENELERIGYKGDVPATPQEEYEAYLELHIEQGPYLVENDVDVGVVQGVVGYTRGTITFYGEVDHSGGTPMHHRSDALVPAADVITQIRRIPSKLGERTVGTAGRIGASPNQVNAIPGEVTVTWEFRDASDAIVDQAREHVLEEANAAARREGIDWEYEDTARFDSSRSSQQCIKAIETAAEKLEYKSMEIFSKAGHDAQNVAAVCDTGMVYAVNESGRSHTVEEYTGWEYCFKSANVLANAALNLSKK